jgi:glycyl-tRNA synthetase alpha subunit
MPEKEYETYVILYDYKKKIKDIDSIEKDAIIHNIYDNTLGFRIGSRYVPAITFEEMGRQFEEARPRVSEEISDDELLFNIFTYAKTDCLMVIKEGLAKIATYPELYKSIKNPCFNVQAMGSDTYRPVFRKDEKEPFYSRIKNFFSRKKKEKK